MRAGLIIYGSLATISGGYLYDRRLVDYLEGQGDDVEVFSLPWRSYPRHLADNLTPPFEERLARGRLDVLLQDELNHPSLPRLNRRLRGRDGPPVVAIVHHLRSSEARAVWPNRLYRLVERAYLRGIDGFVFNSATTRRAVEALAGAGRPSIVAHPGGDRLAATIGAEGVAQRATRPGPLHVLFVGNVIPRKGLHTLLRALAGITPPAWRLTVVGSLTADQSYARAIGRQIERAGLSARVDMRGSVSDAELAACLAASHVLAVPSTYEGFGIVYVEAMAFGLPVIATTAGAAGEVVSDGRDGFLIAPGDVAALAARIDLLSQDRARLTAMGRAAVARAAAHPGWEETTRRIRAFLLGLIATRPASGAPARREG